MMKPPIISAEIAQELNSDLQKIDPRLFFSCNYTPSPVQVMNEDGWFITAIQDLYKFAFDSTFFFDEYICEEIFDECIYKDKSGKEYRSIKHLLETVSTLRSVIDHNQNEDNGLYQALYLEKYDAWIKKHSQKDHIESPEDYKPLNEELRNIAEALIGAAREFIFKKSICNETEKKAFAAATIEKTISWYSKGVKTIIYKGMVANYYNLSLKNPKDINAFLNKICRVYCIFRKNQNDAHLKKCAKTVILCENARSLGLGNKLSPKAIAEEIDAKNDLGQAESYSPSCSWWRYFESEFLSTALKATQERLDKENIAYTLLPESLIDKNIGEIFHNIKEDTRWEHLIAKEN